MAGDGGYGGGREPPRDLVLRPARMDELARLIDIERVGTELLAAHGYPQLLAGPGLSPEAFGALIDSHDFEVADVGGHAVGYGAARPLAGLYWLRELSVDPPYGRRGIGAALLEGVLERARLSGHGMAGLSTFSDVPFNAPFYARHGFVAVDPGTAAREIARRFAAEVPAGVDASRRVLMLRRL